MSTTTQPAPDDTIDLDALRTLMDGRWGHVRADVRRELGDRRLHPDPTWSLAEHRQRVRELVRALAEGGTNRLGFSAEYGGSDDIGGSVTSIEMLAYGDLSLMVKVGVHWGLFGGAVQALGTKRHHDRYLRAIMDYELPGCFAMTESGHGSNVQALETTATFDPDSDEFVVHSPTPTARKDYIGNAAEDGRMAVVFAQLITPAGRNGVHALMVPIRDEHGGALPGVTISDCGPKAGLNGVDNGRLVFDRVRVPRDALLNRYGDVSRDGTYSSPIENESRRFFTMLGTLVRGRVSVAGSAASATQTALVIAVRYALQRRQFTAPGSDDEVLLLDWLAHQRKLLPALATSYALHFAQQELVATLHDVQVGGTSDEEAQQALESMAAGIKAVTTWHATATIQLCREACGGAGYLAENRFPQLKADTDVFTTFEGDNTVLLQLVAKGLLTDYRDHFADLDTLGTVRFLAEQIVETLTERTAARRLAERFRDPEVTDPEWHQELFDDRAEHMLSGLARRLRRGNEPDADAFAVFNAAQDHLLGTARAHIAAQVLATFGRAIDRCADSRVAELLGRVRALYALHDLEADRGWLLEHGRITSGQSKAITAAVDRLCAELRPHARTLVDGFGIPEAWIDAPLLGSIV
jgi:acyl-CoA oxidase